MKPSDIIGKTIKSCEYKVIPDSRCHCPDFFAIEFTDGTSCVVGSNAVGQVLLESVEDAEKYYETKLISR